MTTKITLLLPLFMLFYATYLPAQRPTADDFTMSGDTYQTPEGAYVLTQERDYSSGSIWYRHAIDLNRPFAIEMSLMLGCQDEDGADGMVFAMARQPNVTGFLGEGIGFAGLRPSIGIEIDTWQNFHLNDPPQDHLALLRNGRVGHFTESSRPILIPNIEDCTRHSFIIRWDPTAQTLTVEIDGNLVLSVEEDLINGIFGGDPVIYWGISAATGRYNNYHEVWFDRLS